MFTINEMPSQINPAAISRLSQVETATIGHSRSQGFMDLALRPVIPARRAAGTAVTVSIPGADSTLLHHVMAMLRPGDFLVIDRCADRRHACWGGIITHAARRIGLAGVVVDGPVTDLGDIREIGLPVWSRGVSPITTRLLALGGAFNVPVACGGVAVTPGGAILADESGILFLPRDEVEAVGEAGLARQEREKGIIARILAGEAVGEVSGASAKLASALKTGA